MGPYDSIEHETHEEGVVVDAKTCNSTLARNRKMTIAANVLAGYSCLYAGGWSNSLSLVHPVKAGSPCLA